MIIVKRHKRHVDGRDVNVRKHYRKARKYWAKSQNEVERMLDEKEQEDSNITEFLQIASGESVTDISTLNDLGSREGVEVDKVELKETSESTHNTGGDGQTVDGDGE